MNSEYLDEIARVREEIKQEENEQNNRLCEKVNAADISRSKQKLIQEMILGREINYRKPKGKLLAKCKYVSLGHN